MQETIFTIIKYFLGFLAIIFIALIIYGGFYWMTSLGNEQRVAWAKKILFNAVIGLLIVMISYALTLFIFRVLIEATGAD